MDCAESAVFVGVAGWLNTRSDDCKGGFHRAGAMGIVGFVCGSGRFNRQGS